MPANNVAVLIFSFIALCVFIFCAAAIVVQSRFHDIKCSLLNDYENTRLKLVKEWEEAEEKYTNEIVRLKSELKDMKNQIVTKEMLYESLNNAAALGIKHEADDILKPPSSLKVLLGGKNKLH